MKKYFRVAGVFIFGLGCGALGQAGYFADWTGHPAVLLMFMLLGLTLYTGGQEDG